MDGWLLPHCCSIRGNPARYFWHRQPRYGPGLAGHCEVVLSPVLARLCRECDDKAVRACLAGLARSGRELGLAFASAQSVHVGLVLWRFHGLGPGMVFFWVGTFCTYLLALFSLPPLRDRLAPRLALVFVADFIVFPVLNNGLNKYPLTYLPFALMIVSGVGLRVLSHCFFRKV